MNRNLMIIVAGLALLTPMAAGQSLADRLESVRKARDRANAAQRDTKSQMLGALLYTDVTVRFDETPVREAIDYLKNVLGINIVGRYNDDRTGVGIDPELTITLDVKNKPALDVLEMILDQAEEDEGNTWQLGKGYVEVGTKERLSAKRAQEIRYYPIRDLLIVVPNFDNAPELNLNTALNQGGRGGRGGGGGSGGGSGGGGGGFGGGGGGGGGGNSGGGGSGGGGGGGIFGSPDEEEDRMTETERANLIKNLIMDTVEPEDWVERGGEYATIRYYQGTLIIRAPDFIHRQIGGYGFSPRRMARTSQASADRRFVTFSGDGSRVESYDDYDARTAHANGAHAAIPEVTNENGTPDHK